MRALDLIRTMWLHTAWAETEIVQALEAAGGASDEAWREYTHILGADEVWLARIEQRAARTAVWPTLTPPHALELRAAVAKHYADLLEHLDEIGLARPVTYTTSDGRTFTNTLGEILTHVALHAQYHRGKVNLLLRQHHALPAPVDFIGYIRGAPAATQASSSLSPRSAHP